MNNRCIHFLCFELTVHPDDANVLMALLKRSLDIEAEANHIEINNFVLKCSRQYFAVMNLIIILK